MHPNENFVSEVSRYRPDIDGLRALAVLIVVGCHAFPQFVPGGYVGVDVFFVISGFLITGIILNDLRLDRFTFARFYARRIRRIFPALILVLVASFALGWLYLIPTEFISLGKSIAGGAGFAANIVQFGESGYFDVEAARKPLLHLWSLGIEEQFYIVWPLFLIVTVRRRAGLFYLIAGLGVASLALNLATIKTHASAAFYLPHTRAWELMMGGLLACMAAKQTPIRIATGLERAASFLRAVVARLGHRSEHVIFDVQALFGILLIASAVAFLHRNSTYPGWRALLPTLGTFLLICAEPSWFNRRVLSNRALVFVGLISYPLYLWHWLLLSFARVAEPNEPPASLIILLVIAAFILAVLTYRLIEKPVRFGKPVRLKVIALCGLMAATGCIGLATVKNDGFEIRIPEAMREMLRANIAVDLGKDWRLGTCFLGTQDDKSKFAESCIDKGPRPLLFLWGDSVAASLYPGLRRAQALYDFGIGQFDAASCPPIVSYVRLEPRFCKDDNEFALALIRQHRPDIVVLSSDYRGVTPEQLAITVQALKQIGNFRIVIVGPPVSWRGRGPQEFILRYSSANALAPLRTNLYLYESVRDQDKILEEKARGWGVDYISVWDVMCNPEGCLTRVGPNARDISAFTSVHLTLSGSAFLADAIMPRLLGMAPRERSAP